MKKIPTLFKREFENNRVVKALPELSDVSLSWVLAGDGIATEKIDGACCAVIEGKFYKRYDAKKDNHGNLKSPPAGAIPCGEPDMVTGHWPHWVLVEEKDPADQWFVSAYKNSSTSFPDGTYEAVGLHSNGNPYCLERDYLIPHGKTVIDLPDRSFEGIRSYLSKHAIEGIVFWKDGTPQCKIKRSDFGLPWPDKAHLPHIDYYLYEFIAPDEYVEILRKIAESNHMTIEEMIVEGMKYFTAHHELIRQWGDQLCALPEKEKQNLECIHLRKIEPIYSDTLWLEQYTGGAT